jgi:hypothetical protein
LLNCWLSKCGERSELRKNVWHFYPSKGGERGEPKEYVALLASVGPAGKASLTSMFFFNCWLSKFSKQSEPRKMFAAPMGQGICFSCCWFCECGEQSEPKKNVCRTVCFVNAAKEHVK